MQRKIIFAFIALGFGVSMELVLALHILFGPGNTHNSSAQSANEILVSTIAINYAQTSPSAQAGETNQYAPEAQETAGSESTSDSGAYLPPEDYPAPTDDIQPGSEPPDSASPASGNPSDTYPPPNDNSGGNGGDYPLPPEDSYPFPEPETDTPAQPTATYVQINPVPTALPTDAPADQRTAIPSTVPTSVPTAVPTTVSTAAPTTAATTPPPAASSTSSVTPTASSNTTPSAAPTSAPSATQNSQGVLVSVPASAAPKLDGAGSDPAWANAPALTVTTTGGANQSATKITIQSVYDSGNIYFLVTWADPSQSFLLNPWEMQAGGKWKLLTGPENKGGDESQYYMDKLALLWPIHNSLPGFDSSGCAGACHTGEGPQAKAYGTMYTAAKGQIADLWQWKSVVNVGQVDDDYLDDTRYSKDAFWAGFHGDPGEGGYYSNQTQNRSAPAYMPPNGGVKTGAPGYILDAEKAKLDPGLFKPGQRVPGVLVAPFQGDRGDIHAGWRHADGKWTLEFGRKLVTGSTFDVQFDDLSKLYSFALATFDNTQIRHAYQNGANVLKFQK